MREFLEKLSAQMGFTYCPNCHQLAGAIFGFFGQDLPENWHTIRSTVTDNFRVVTPGQTV
ncbi:MAG: hypothetical protein OXC09_05445 [Truepera sp.]|nr:hypothetical protein [Truepera sp.]